MPPTYCVAVSSAEPLAGELWAGLRQATSALGLKEEADIARQHERGSALHLWWTWLQ